MFAIIDISGTQFKVEKGSKIEVGQLQEKEGATIQINSVLLLNDNGKISIGTPLLIGAYAEAKVLGDKRGEKVLVYKMKAKKRYRRTQGYRSDLTILEITDIKATGGKAPEKKAVKTGDLEVIAKKPATPKTEKAATKKPAAKKAPAKKAVKKD